MRITNKEIENCTHQLVSPFFVFSIIVFICSSHFIKALQFSSVRKMPFFVGAVLPSSSFTYSRIFTDGSPRNYFLILPPNFHTSFTVTAFREEIEIIHPYSSSYRGSELFSSCLQTFTSRQRTVSKQENERFYSRLSRFSVASKLTIYLSIYPSLPSFQNTENISVRNPLLSQTNSAH